MKAKLLILLLFLIPLVSAAPPFTLESDGTADFEIKSPSVDIVKQNGNFEWEIHVYNRSTGLPINKDISCYFHLYNSSGNHILELIDTDPSHTFDYSFNVGGGNFSEIETHPYVIQCNSSTQGGFFSSEIDVTKSGDHEETKDAIVGVVIIILMLGVTLLLMFTSMNLNHILLQMPFATLTLYFIAFDFFMVGRIIEEVDAILVGMIQNIYSLYGAFMMLGHFALMSTVVVLLWYFFTKLIMNKKDERGLNGED